MQSLKIRSSCKPSDWSIRIAHRQPRLWEGSKVHLLPVTESLRSRIVDAFKTFKIKLRKTKSK
jgi:hypothetical protein